MMQPFRLPNGPDVQTCSELIAWCRRECGDWPRDEPSSAGAVLLAGWLLADRQRAEAAATKSDGVLRMGHTIRRLIAGRVVPSEALAIAIAALTKGAVEPGSWEVQSKPLDFKATLPDADEKESFRGESPAIAVDDHYVGSAVLGETPAGPLWSVLPPVPGANFYEVHGLGLSFRLSAAAAGALHGSLAGAIAKTGAAREAVRA